MDTQAQIENLILRYLSGDASEQEVQEIQMWLQASEENRKLFASHKKLWLGSRALSTYDIDKIKQDKYNVDLKIRNSELQRILNRANKHIRILAYAASIILLLGVTSVFYILQQRVPSKQGITLAGGKIEVPYGSKSLVTLPDGSKVWINAGSKISYSTDFGITSRTVYLTGEAYFDVAKMEQIPFFVNTDVMKIKVYGTAFNVKAYSDDNWVETTLDRGAISIIRNDTPDQEISVVPNQKITIRREIQKLATTPIPTATTQPEPLERLDVQEIKNTEAITAWKDNRLVFDQEPLWSLAKRLERQYNVRIKFSNDKIRNIRYTAALKEMPIDQVLEAISMTSPISYKIKGAEIVLTENKNFEQKK